MLTPLPSGHDSDYGIDLRIEVVKNSYHIGTDFNVQIKGTNTIPKSAKRRRIRLKRRTISYLLNKVSPTMLALCDVRTERIYYSWLQLTVDDLTTKRTENTITFEIDFSREISNDFEQRAIRFLESYYRPIFLGLRNPAKIQHLTYGSFQVAQVYEFLSKAYIMGWVSLLREAGQVEASRSYQEGLPWAVTWAVNVMGMFFPLFKKFIEIYEEKYFSEENIADKQLMQLYQELRRTVSVFLPVADLENQRGPNVIEAGDFLIGRVNTQMMWEKSQETLDCLQSLSEKLREIVLLAWNLEKRQIKK